MCQDLKELERKRNDASINVGDVDTLCVLAIFFFVNADKGAKEEMLDYDIASIFKVIKKQNQFTNELLNEMDELLF